MPKVSVVIPLYNKEPHIARTLNSVLTQTFQDFEVIVVDDGSTDSGAKVVRGFDDPRIRLIQQENQGVSAARNRGIEAAKAELIAFLDADDEWLPAFIETILRLKERFPDAGAYATACRIYLPNGKYKKIKYWGIPLGEWEGLIPSYFETCNKGDLPITASSCAVPKNIFLEVGLFKVGAWWGEDSDLWGRIALKYSIAFSRIENAVYFLNAENRACRKHKSVQMHPFVITAFNEFNTTSKMVKPGLKEYLDNKIVGTLYRNLFAGDHKSVKEILTKYSCIPTKTKVWFSFWCYVPQLILSGLLLTYENSFKKIKLNLISDNR